MKYTTIKGETIEFKPSQAEKAYIEKLEGAASDSAVTEDQMIDFIWSVDNPVLKNGPNNKKGYADKETYQNLAFRVMLDLEDRKRIKLGSLDLNLSRGKYTLTVPEAALELGIHETSVRKAILNKRLDGWQDKPGSPYFLNPDSVASYKISNRGARAAKQILKARFGNHGGYSFRIKPDLVDTKRVIEQVIEGRLKPFSGCSVLVCGDKKCTYYELAPGNEENRIDIKEFFVTGRFSVKRKINNTRQAREAFKSYNPAVV